MNKTKIYLLQAVDEEDGYKLSVMAINVEKKPTPEMIKESMLFMLGIEDDDEDNPLDPITEQLCDFDSECSYHSYSLYWEMTCLYTE